MDTAKRATVSAMECGDPSSTMAVPANAAGIARCNLRSKRRSELRDTATIANKPKMCGIITRRPIALFESCPEANLISCGIQNASMYTPQFDVKTSKPVCQTRRIFSASSVPICKQIGTLEALKIRRVWHTGLLVFTSNCGVYMLAFWMPQLIKFASGQLSNSAIGRLVMIPHIFGLFAMVAVSRSSDRRFERRLHLAIPAAFAGTAMVLLGSPHSIAETVALLAVSIAGMISVYGPAYSLPSELLSGPAVAAGLGMASSIANSAGFVGPYAAGWISQRTGSLYGGLSAAGISLFVCTMLALLLPKKKIAS